MVGRPFQPGQSGNPAGRPKSKPFKEALERALKAASGDKDALEACADALVSKSMMGDVPAIKELADRLDGKVTQLIGGDDEAPIKIQRIETVIVDPKSGDS